MRVSPIYIGHEALRALCDYVREHAFDRLTLVADDNTWRALGQAAYGALTTAGVDVQVVRLETSGDAEDIVADEARIVEILLPGDQADRVFVAAGSGTLTDLTRFVSHRLGRPFISLPTAPSVDAYTSANAPVVIKRLKRTLDAHQPLAIFADLDVLCAAPPAMIGAGVGDVLGKYTALADWRLGALLWDEALDEDVVASMYTALESVSENASAIGRRDPEAIAALMQALLDSGSAMARWHNSRPASGAEHHLSHYWEMMLLQAGRPAVLHGAKVGVATAIIARAYARLRATSRQEAADRMAQAPLPERAEQERLIRAGYGALADEVIAAQDEMLALTSERWERLQADLLEQWDAVQAIAGSVPPPERIAAQLETVGAPTDPEALGLTRLEIDNALQYGHFIRNRFTVRYVEQALGLR